MKKHFQRQMGSAGATFIENELTVWTGQVQRSWQHTEQGLVTTACRNQSTGTQWTVDKPRYRCDWILPGLAITPDGAELLDAKIEEADDEGFTSRHLRVVLTFAYPQAALAVAFEVWAYPEAPGLRTQLWIRAQDGYEPTRAGATGRVDYLPVAFENTACRLFGYYNDTQNRNAPGQDILNEQVVHEMPTCEETYAWNNALCLERDGQGLAVLQESHRCVNRSGHDTGCFRCDPQRGLSVDGWGVLPTEIRLDRFRPAWATWLLTYGNGETARQLAFKQFDRLRYPVDYERDVYLIANSWGSGQPGTVARHAARAENIIREIDSQADLGIDVQQIDHGWHGEEITEWRPDPERYPEGWKPVLDRARQKGVTLGLWVAGQQIQLEDLKRLWQEGGFVQYKVDGLHMPDADSIEEMMQKAREFIKHTGHRVRMNWDVTENEIRVGYFFAKEYGSLFLENRKASDRKNRITYRPHTVLRDLWQLSRYMNLNRIQGDVQNVDNTNPEATDAHWHSHAYSVAITLMATPLFFQETQLYTDAARKQIRPLLARYRQHRDAIYRGFVFPIGEKPSNESWTGFQCDLPDEDAGYLLIFRELENNDSKRRLSLHRLTGRRITLTNIADENGGTSEVDVDKNGAISLRIDQAPDFLFLRYDPA